MSNRHAISSTLSSSRHQHATSASQHERELSPAEFGVGWVHPWVGLG